jgi:ribosomal protein S19E (S16A)
MQVPDWVDVVKTNVAKELAPYDEDWFYIRTAGIARHLYIRAPVGVNAIKKVYGGNCFNFGTESTTVGSVSDSHPFHTDPDPAFELNADPN